MSWFIIFYIRVTIIFALEEWWQRFCLNLSHSKIVLFIYFNFSTKIFICYYYYKLIIKIVVDITFCNLWWKKKYIKCIENGCGLTFRGPAAQLYLALNYVDKFNLVLYGPTFIESTKHQPLLKKKRTSLNFYSLFLLFLIVLEKWNIVLHFNPFRLKVTVGAHIILQVNQL